MNSCDCLKVLDNVKPDSTELNTQNYSFPQDHATATPTVLLKTINDKQSELIQTHKLALSMMDDERCRRSLETIMIHSCLLARVTNATPSQCIEIITSHIVAGLSINNIRLY
jgi:hypothetical protein